MTELPALTHLQFLILGFLRSGEASGKHLRAQLKRGGTRRTGPGFYQLMARLEDVELITGWYAQEIVEGQIIRERFYRLNATGLQAWRESRDFYLDWIERFGQEPLTS